LTASVLSFSVHASECAEELPTERTGRVETEEGFRGTRLLMGGLPSLVESLSAHAVQSGFVPPLSTCSNGTSGTVNVAENQILREVSDEPMVTEPSVSEQQRVTERISADGSGDSHPDAAGPDRSMADDVSSDVMHESDNMEIIEQDAGKTTSRGRS
jgi:hypothetical protein